MYEQMLSESTGSVALVLNNIICNTTSIKRKAALGGIKYVYLWLAKKGSCDRFFRLPVMPMELSAGQSLMVLDCNDW